MEVPAESGERRLQSHRLHLSPSGDRGAAAEEMSRQMVGDIWSSLTIVLYKLYFPQLKERLSPSRATQTLQITMISSIQNTDLYSTVILYTTLFTHHHMVAKKIT